MVMVPVSSSNLSSVGYENGTLYIAFNHGGVYAYFDVPSSVHEELMAADSHGKYFARFIRNVYTYRRIS